ncbi:hypothetical protein NCS52_00149300 [Fusarium sp. LHS14.1]|nr:hypothetical protein NCS52_00149300 [Fusarium sp. LHS14.1]
MAVKSFPILAGLNCVCDQPLYSVVRPIHLAEPPSNRGFCHGFSRHSQQLQESQVGDGKPADSLPQEKPTNNHSDSSSCLPTYRSTEDTQPIAKTPIEHTHTHTTDRGLAAFQDLGRGRRNLVFVQFVKDMELGNDLVYGYMYMGWKMFVWVFEMKRSIMAGDYLELNTYKVIINHITWDTSLLSLFICSSCLLVSLIVF